MLSHNDLRQSALSYKCKTYPKGRACTFGARRTQGDEAMDYTKLSKAELAIECKRVCGVSLSYWSKAAMVKMLEHAAECVRKDRARCKAIDACGWTGGRSDA